MCRSRLRDEAVNLVPNLLVMPDQHVPAGHCDQPTVWNPPGDLLSACELPRVVRRLEYQRRHPDLLVRYGG